MSEIEITVENFEEVVERSEKPVLVDFWATWCGPCRMLAPIVAQIAAEQDAVIVGKVNTDEQQELAERFGVMSIPTLIFFKGGKEAGRSVGVRPKSDILNMINA